MGMEMSISLEQLYQLTHQHDGIAAASADLVDYGKTLAAQLVEACDEVTACDVISQPQPAPHLIVVSDDPYLALKVTMTEQDKMWPFIQIWGDSAARAWRQHDLQLTQDVILQRQTADIVLRNLPARSNIDAMLQTAADTIGQLLGASAVNIYFNPEPSSSTQKSE